MNNNPADNREVVRFLKEHEHEMPDLYKAYNWDDDTYDDGFPKLFDLEQKIIEAAKENSFDKTHLMMIAIWGKLRNKKRIERFDEEFKITLYVNGEPAFQSLY